MAVKLLRQARRPRLSIQAEARPGRQWRLGRAFHAHGGAHLSASMNRTLHYSVGSGKGVAQPKDLVPLVVPLPARPLVFEAVDVEPPTHTLAKPL
jgi:hypothetical protein